MAITYRSVKGSALSSDEVDENFRELSDDIDAIIAGTVTITEIRMEDDDGVLRRIKIDASGNFYTEII